MDEIRALDGRREKPEPPVRQPKRFVDKIPSHAIEPMFANLPISPCEDEEGTMSISFPCGGCGQRYDLADELAGKRFKCKKCGVPVAVPIPRKPVPSQPVAAEPDPFADLDDMEDDEEVAADSGDEEEEEEYVRPAFTPARRGAGGRGAKQAVASGPNWLLIGGIGGGTLVLGLLIGLGVWLFQASGGVAAEDGVNVNEKGFPQNKPVDPTAEQEKLMKKMSDNFKDLIALLREVKDADSAKSVAPRLSAKLEEQFAMGQSGKNIINPDKKKEKELQDKFLADLQKTMPDFMKEMMRIQAIPGSDEIKKVFETAVKKVQAQAQAQAPGMPGGGIPQGYPGTGGPSGSAGSLNRRAAPK